MMRSLITECAKNIVIGYLLFKLLMYDLKMADRSVVCLLAPRFC